MKKTIEVSAKKVDDAIKEGLRILGVSMTDDGVDIKIISHGGFLKKAKVEISVGEDEVKKEVKPAPAPQDVKASVKPQEKQKPEQKPVQNAEQKQKPEQRPVQNAEQKQSGFKPDQNNFKQSSQNTEQKQNSPKPVEKQNNLKPAERQNERPQQRPQNNYKNETSGKKEEKNFLPKKQERKFEDKPIMSAPATKEHADICEKFLTEVLKNVGIEAAFNISIDNGVDIIIETTDSAIIGYRGEMLDAVQYLTSLIINNNENKHIRVSVDALGYREKRIDALKRLALKMADKALTNQRKVILEPMSSAERRVIHAALSENADVITKSEGHEPNRRVVVLPVRK